MSDGSATYQEMLSLIRLAQEKVYSSYGIELENEVQIITNI
jgi:UDP-N-acetylenolpyruvoylglucosamine reductase